MDQGIGDCWDLLSLALGFFVDRDLGMPGMSLDVCSTLYIVSFFSHILGIYLIYHDNYIT